MQINTKNQTRDAPDVDQACSPVREQTRDWNEDTHWPGQISDYEFNSNVTMDQGADRRNYRSHALSLGRRGKIRNIPG